jgi:hypothetical protein
VIVVFQISNKFLEFNNIEEIKFTRVGEDVFTISIKSDITMNDKDLEDCTFKSELCKLDSSIELRLGTEQTYVNTGYNVVSSQCFNIPLNVNLLLNKDLQNFFTLYTKDKKED